MDPLPFAGPAEEALLRVRKAVEKLPRTTLVRAEPGYLHFEVRSLVFRFVDDLEFLVDQEQQVIHFRSASRAGYSDMGVNRRRMERIAKLFNESG